MTTLFSEHVDLEIDASCCFTCVGCRLEDLNSLFKAFNGGKAANFKADGLADQVTDPA